MKSVSTQNRASRDGWLYFFHLSACAIAHRWGLFISSDNRRKGTKEDCYPNPYIGALVDSEGKPSTSKFWYGSPAFAPSGFAINCLSAIAIKGGMGYAPFRL